MTGKEVIIHYLETHQNFCATDVAESTSATIVSINREEGILAKEGAR